MKTKKRAESLKVLKRSDSNKEIENPTKNFLSNFLCIMQIERSYNRFRNKLRKSSVQSLPESFEGKYNIF